ncbi:hypothetical protein JCM9279_002046 [Rhodotorula babjevae]
MVTLASQPVTRSRTSLFLSYRDSAARPTPSTPFTRYTYDDDDLGDEEAGLIGGNQLRTPQISQRGGTTDDSALPPRWVDEADQVDSLVRQVKPKIAHLDKLHAKHLLPGFKDRSAEEREIQALATSITSDFRSCQAHIRRIAVQSQQLLASRPRDAAQAEVKRIDLVMAANVQTALATKVQALSTVFRKNQAEYLRQLRGNESKAVELQNRATTVYDPLVALAEDEQASRSALSSSSSPSAGASTPSLAQQQFFASHQSSSMSTAAADQRSSEIADIAQSIADLADLFKDLSSLVIDQGTLLDRVDWNVEVMSTEVRGAAEELREATRYQRRSGKCQLIFLLVLLVIAACVVLLFRPPRILRSSPGGGALGAAAAHGDGRATTEQVAQAISDELGARRRGALGGLEELVERAGDAASAEHRRSSRAERARGEERTPPWTGEGSVRGVAASGEGAQGVASGRRRRRRRAARQDGSEEVQRRDRGQRGPAGG